MVRTSRSFSTAQTYVWTSNTTFSYLASSLIMQGAAMVRTSQSFSTTQTYVGTNNHYVSHLASSLIMQGATHGPHFPVIFDNSNLRMDQKPPRSYLASSLIMQ